MQRGCFFSVEGPETEKKHVELADKGWTGCPCGSNVAPQSGGENVCQMCGAVFDHSRLGEGSCDGFFFKSSRNGWYIDTSSIDFRM